MSGPERGRGESPMTTTSTSGSSRRGVRCRTVMATLGIIALPFGVSAAAVASADATSFGAAQATGTATADQPAPPPAPAPEPGDEVDTAALDAFLDAGYSYVDAEYLAAAWNLGDPFEAKVKAGGYLLESVPLVDTPLADPSGDDGLSGEQLVDVFLSFGYTLADAEVLAERWEVPVEDAKVFAGSELKVVGVLPLVDVAGDVGPGGDQALSEADIAAAGVFLDAGCTYDDAVVLAGYWSLGEDTYAAKVKAGSLLVEGLALPTTDPALGC